MERTPARRPTKEECYQAVSKGPEHRYGRLQFLQFLLAMALLLFAQDTIHTVDTKDSQVVPPSVAVGSAYVAAEFGEQLDLVIDRDPTPFVNEVMVFMQLRDGGFVLGLPPECESAAALVSRTETHTTTMYTLWCTERQGESSVREAFVIGHLLVEEGSKYNDEFTVAFLPHGSRTGRIVGGRPLSRENLPELPPAPRRLGPQALKFDPQTAS